MRLRALLLLLLAAPVSAAPTLLRKEQIKPCASGEYLVVSGGAWTCATAPVGYTDELAQDGIGGILVDSTRIDLTYNDGVPSITADLIADTITAGYLHASATDILFGRSTAAAGPGEEITCTAAARSLLNDATTGDMRTTLGLAIGTDVQAYDAELAAIAGLTSAADKGIQFTGAGTAAVYDLTTAGKALLDDASAAAQATTLGLGTGDSPQFTAVNVGHASDTTLARSGAGDLAVEGNALYRAGGTDVPIADGGTGSSTAAAARVALLPALATNALKVLRVAAGEADVEFAADGVADGDKGDVTVSASGATWTIDADAVTDTKLRDSAAVSVIGRSANSTGDPGDIAASADGQVLRRSASAVGFGALDLADSDGVTGALDETNGGTGQSTITAGDLLYGSGANTLSKLAIGSTGNVLTVVSGAPAWAAPAAVSGMSQTKIKTADESVTSSTAHQVDDVLTFDYAASESWAFTITLFVEGATAGDWTGYVTRSAANVTLRYGVHGPSASTAWDNAAPEQNAADEIETIGGLGAANQINIGTSGSGAVTVTISGTAYSTSGSGTISLYWAQRVSSGTATTVKAGSFLVATKL